MRHACMPSPRTPLAAKSAPLFAIRLAPLLAPLLMFLCAAPPAWSQNYPVRPVYVVVGYAPGGPVDIVARRIAPYMQQELGQALVVENKPGAGGVVGAAGVARAEADGYTLILQASPTQTIAPFLNASLPFDPLKDYSPISSLVETGFALAINKDFPARNLQELIAYARANPNKVNFGTSGVGSSAHLASELLKKMSGTEMLHVPYKGASAALADVIAGTVTFTFIGIGDVVGQVKGGQVRAIGVSTAVRSPALPDVPTIAEGGLKGFDMSNWFGLEGPPGLGAAVTARLNAAARKSLADPALAKQFADMAYRVIPSSPDEMAEKIRTEYRFWGGMIKSLGLKPE